MASSDVIFPTISPPTEEGELLLGYIWRSSNVNGRKRMKGLVDYLVERQALQPPWTVPSNLQQLCVKLNPVFESAQEVVRKHTILPALLPFVRPDDLARIEAHVYQGTARQGVAPSLGLAGRYIKSKPELALCPQCVEEDLRRLGFSYWRRIHTVPGLCFCHVHRCALLLGCGVCALSQLRSRRPLMPTLECWCGHPRAALSDGWSPGDKAVLIELAAYAQELLDGKLAGRTASEIGAYLHMRAQQDGYANGTRLQTPAIAAAMARRYSERLLVNLNADLSCVPKWVAKSLGARLAPRAATRNLLFFHFFGRHIPDDDDFCAAQVHEAQCAATRGARYESACKTDASTLRNRRARILEYLRVNPGAGRTEVRKALGQTAAAAYTHDHDWYEALLPPRDAARPKSPQARYLYQNQLDNRTSEHVRARYVELMAASGLPKQVTRRVLLLGCARGNEITDERLRRMPRTMAALNDCVEARTAFQKRYARWILCNTPEGADAHRLAKVRTGLTYSQVDAVVAELATERLRG